MKMLPVVSDVHVLQALPFSRELYLWTCKCHRLGQPRNQLIKQDLKRQVRVDVVAWCSAPENQLSCEGVLTKISHRLAVGRGSSRFQTIIILLLLLFCMEISR